MHPTRSAAAVTAVALLTLPLMLTAGCSRPRLEPAAPAPRHPAVPWAAAQVNSDWTPSPSNAYTEPSAGHVGQGGRYIPEGPLPPAPPAPVISAARFTELLPAPPKGWWAEQANIESSLVDDRGHWQSMASRSYAKSWASSSPSVDVSIRVDWGAASTLKDEFDATCAGFGAACKPVTLALGSGHEIEVEASKSTEIAILVEPGLAVQARGHHVTPAELRGWVEQLPADRLRKLLAPTE